VRIGTPVKTEGERILRQIDVRWPRNPALSPRILDELGTSPLRAQMTEAEVAHGARGCADVERIARRDQYDAQTVEFGLSQQGRLF